MGEVIHFLCRRIPNNLCRYTSFGEWERKSPFLKCDQIVYYGKGNYNGKRNFIQTNTTSAR